MFLIAAAAFFFLLTLTNVIFWPRVKGIRGVDGGRVSVLIPARDEESNILACLNTVLEQGGVIGEVLVYDDHSSDHTGALVRELALTNARVRLVQAEPLPAGWCGKNFACSRLALEATNEWMLFLDADARLLPGAVAGMLQASLDRRLTMLSCWPGFTLVNFSERALMPLLNFVVLSIFPSVLSLFRPEASLGLAHGACLLMHRPTYWKVGGHEAVREEIFEDTRLAQLWRQCGHRALCLDGQDVIRVRMYSRFSDIWLGFQKNFFPAFRHEWMFWLFLLFQFTVFLLPFLIANWIAAALVLGVRLLLAVRFGQPWWSMLAHPVAEALMLVLGISSWWHCRSGRGVAWKGRTYRARQV